MRIILLIAIAVISLVNGAGYQAFTASFQAVAPQWGTGYFSGTISYDFVNGMMELKFDDATTDGYTEFYQFNADKGYNPKVPTGQFTYQYLYKTSKSCPCETTALQFAMPALFSTASTDTAPATGIAYWSGSTKPPTANSLYKAPTGKDASTVTQYFANVALKDDVQQRRYFMSDYFFQYDDKSPAGFSIKDVQQRTFMFTNVQDVTPGSLGLKAPTTGCKCGKMLDIVLSMDRSGSIQIWQWRLEWAFTKNVTNAFEYGPLKTNMGIVNWNAAQWVTIDILSGTSLPTVQSAVNSMACCPDKNGNIPTADSASCCCCGTPIGGGLWEAGFMLASSTRTKATKVIIILTDGCQNHIWGNPDTPPYIGAKGTWATSCGCATEKDCQTNTNCTDDITKWYKWVVRAVPTVKIIAVGVGDQNTICTDQLTKAAGGDTTNVYNPQSWTELQTIVQTITATACTTNETLCPDCCGICTCGVCYPAKQCYDKDKCNTGVVDPGTGCCSTTPVNCTAGPCQNSRCDPLTGCAVDQVQCRPDDLCYRWYCNATSVVCATERIEPPPNGCSPTVVIPQCIDPTDCDDKNNCTIDDCVSGKCNRTAVNCDGPDLNNACNTTSCKKDKGCVTTTKICNDYNACTSDKCDPKTGCVFTTIDCPVNKDPCFRYICDKASGCALVPIDYEKDCNLTAANCTVPACNGTCYEQYICYTPPPTSDETFPTTVVLSSALGGAAVAGIVIGAAVLAAGLGGGAAVAIAGAAGAGGVVTVSSNPVYKAAGTAGTNPLHKS